MEILRELISQPSDELRSNPIVARSPSLTGGLHANKKIEIRSAQSRDISLLDIPYSTYVCIQWSTVHLKYTVSNI